MKTPKNYLLRGLLVVFLSVLLVNCSDNENTNDGTSRVIIKMTDNPGDYDHVYVEVLDVLMKSNNNPDEAGWVSVGEVNQGIYDLLELTGGVTALLVDNEIPSGYIGQIRLLLGENNSVVKNGEIFPLNTPSAQQSGLKLQVNQNLTPNVTYNFLIDFDVQQSIVVQAGNSGNYNLRPVLRVTTEAVSGSITGIVLPETVQTLVETTLENAETVSAFTNDEGVFVLHGLPSGTYTLTIIPDAESGLESMVIDGVIVVNGEVTDVGTISLE